MTGAHEVQSVDLIQDAGDSLNPTIDVGQIEGGFVMGQSFWTCEHYQYGAAGNLLTNRASSYPIESSLDIPVEFRVQLPSNNPNNPAGVLHSKGINTLDWGKCELIYLAF